MEQRILKLLAAPSYTASTAPQLLKGLGLTGRDLNKLESVLLDMETRGKILRTKGNRYIQAREADLIPGVIQITRGGRGFVQPDEPGIAEVAITDGGTGTAMHGDRVLVRLDIKPQGLRKAAGEPDKGRVVRVLERKRTTFVGTLERGAQFLHVRPDDPRLPSSVFVPEPKDVGRKANVGDKVVVDCYELSSALMTAESVVRRARTW